MSTLSSNDKKLREKKNEDRGCIVVRLSKRGKITIAIILFFFILGVGCFLFIKLHHPVYKEVKVEVGSQIDVSQFIKNEDTKGILKTEITEEMAKTIGEYEVIIDVDGEEYQSLLIIQDTIAPTGSKQTVEVYQNQKITVDMFVKDVKDETKVKTSFQNDVSTAKIGEFDAPVVLEDEAGNQTVVESKLVVKKDDVAPTISGAKDLTVVKGKTVSYKKGVTVKDNVDESVELKVDSSQVNLNKVGKYKVVYTATDSSQNTTSKTVYVNVFNEANAPVSEDEVYARADEVLAKIMNNSMTKREKCRKIFNWVHANMSFINDSDKSSWTKAAMYGFNNHKGDCYNYFAVTKALLTRAGIENIDLKATKHTHFWNFVKVEEGWYHLDTTPRVDHPNLFLRTDAWMDAYSVKHKNCFSYDPASKPASATK